MNKSRKPMNPFKRDYRIWWKKPRKYSDQQPDRSVTFLELFYDLVFVVIIAELSHSLAEDVNLHSFLEFVFLFLIVWWAWFNGALYHDLHGNNDVKTRVVTFAKMFAVASMAIFAHDAMGESSKGFAISYAFFLLLITSLWWRTGVYDKDHASVSFPYSGTFLIATGLVIVSVFVEEQLRYILWAISLFLIMSLPLVLFLISRKKPKMAIQIKRSSAISPAMVERFGLLTIIVLGEVIAGVIHGVASHHEINQKLIISVAIGMGIAMGLWWLYFDMISVYEPKKGMFAHASWLYLHLPLLISITAIGSSLLTILHSIGEELSWNSKLLLISAVTISYISIGLLLYSVKVPETHKKIHLVARIVTFAAAIITPVLLFFNLKTLLLLIILLAIMTAPIFFSFRFWIKEQKNRMKKNSLNEN